MGCATSKQLEESPAVALCRQRCAFLDEAIQQRYAFSAAHMAYLASLKSVGLSLHRFFNHHLDDTHHHSDHDDSGSPDFSHHLDNDVSNTTALLNQPYSGDAGDVTYSPEYDRSVDKTSYMNFYHMKKESTPSLVLYAQQQPVHHVSDSSPFYHISPHYYYLNNNNDSNNKTKASTSKAVLPPPAPPSPPRGGSEWDDFLNPFESYENKFYLPYRTPSMNSMEVRAQEGIPDLEEEDDDVHEVIKEVQGGQKLLKKSGGSMNDAHARPRFEEKPSKVEEYEVHVVDDAKEWLKDKTNHANKVRADLKSGFEVVSEIQVQFERASEAGSEVSKFLEAGKVVHRRKSARQYHVSSNLLRLSAIPSLSSASGSADIDLADPAYSDVDKDFRLSSRNLSSTFHKLYIWEKKLYEEIKAEEKMRVLYEQKSAKLKHLDIKGADARQVDMTRTFVRNLSTKINIAIQVIDKISMKISTLRDQELWPQLNELIQELARMWKSMLECHRNQCQAIRQAKSLNISAIDKHFSDAHLESTKQLEHDLINCTLNFSNWIYVQKNYVRALSNWLMKCLLYIPEESADGPVPFSPGRMGAPQVFVVCHQWCQSLEKISEKEVVDSMRDLVGSVFQIWDRDKVEMRQRMVENKDEGKVTSLEKEDQKLRKEIQALQKRMALIDNGLALTGQVVYQGDVARVGGGLNVCLERVLEALERFVGYSARVYDELLQRFEEDHLSGE